MTLCSGCHSQIPVGEKIYSGLLSNKCYCSNCMSDPYGSMSPDKKEKQ